MLADKHYDYEREKDYLVKTTKAMDEDINYLTNEISNSEEELSKFIKGMGGNYSDEIVVKLSIHDSYKRKLKMLKRAKDKPYFGRIDFQELGKDKMEIFYVGKTSVTRREDEKRFVIDWRTPMAGLYYSGEIGEVMYNAPKGLIMGDLELKRQYEIQNRKLINIFDKGLTPMDEYLQEALWEKKDNRLSDIVTTIQGEQNDIIRAGEDKVIIVQGVAGSGKTTIVLHRIAYLMYTYQEIFQPDKLLIVVPNRLFLNYISDVLPDLGVEEINQTTFEDLSMKLLEENLKISSNEEKFYKLLNSDKDNKTQNENLRYSSWFKGALQLKEVLDNYIEEITKELAPKKAFNIGKYIVFSQKEMIEMFTHQYSYLPLEARIERIKKYIRDNIKERVEHIQNKINKEYDKRIKEIKSKISDEEDLRKAIIKEYDERDNIKDTLEKSIKSSINSYFKEFSNIDIVESYKEFISNKEKLVKYCKGKIEEEKIDFIAKYSKKNFENGEFEREDLPPLLYLYMKLSGTDLKGKFNHIVVDEAQDYSEFQMYILKELSSNSSFTIVGDLSQGIHSYKGIKTWNSFIDEVFKENEVEFLTLRNCYRSTMEIMKFANQVIQKWGNENITLAEPVLRSGEKPFIIKGKDDNHIQSDICRKIDSLKEEGFKSIAVICKDNKESLKVYKKLEDRYNETIHLITDNDTMYDGGVVVIPAYMAKGLEFDAVIIYDCSADTYIQDELSIKLLYVALTRPLHRLYIYYKDKPSPLIEVDNEYYNELSI